MQSQDCSESFSNAVKKIALREISFFFKKIMRIAYSRSFLSENEANKMEKVHMRLTVPQAKKLMRGGVIQLKPDALKDNAHYLILEKRTANKVRRAQRAGKGCRICLSRHEMENSGEGIKEFLEKLKNAGKWIKEKVIDTPFYQESIKPLVRQGVDTGMQLLAPKLGKAGPAANMAVNKLGEYSGAYGLREDFQRFGKKAKDFYQQHAKKYVAPHLRGAIQSAEKALVNRAKKMAPQYATDIDKLHEEYGERAITELGNRTGAFGLRKGRGLQNDYSNFLNPSHPAMHPAAASLPAIGGWVYMYPVNDGPFPVSRRPMNKQGGSFKVAGAGRGRRGFGPGSGSFRPA